jgi:hypothetical protein
MKLRPAAEPPVRASGPVEGVWGNREVLPGQLPDDNKGAEE